MQNQEKKCQKIAINKKQLRCTQAVAMPCNDDGALELHLSDPEISEPEDSADASAEIISLHFG